VQFKDTKSAYLQEQLVDQFCVVSGGPCTYKGADMKTSHANMDITKAQFNILVEVLQVAMDARGIPFATQNQLLARLAPMHRDVITAR
jgi:hemoglobin